MLIDSNIIIAFAKDNSFDEFSSKFDREFFASKITELEVLGYHSLSNKDKLELERIFSIISLIEIDNTVIAEAIRLRQKKSMSVGDVIIAATALINNLPLVTANTADFKWIKNLELINPLT
jgi:hypothetical protein